MDGKEALLAALKAGKIERQLAELLHASACAVPYLIEHGEPHEAALELNEAIADAYVAAVAFKEERIRRW